MKTFFNAKDLGDITAALAEAQEVKANRYGYQHLGKNKTLLMVFFNNSLRTRLSTQKAAMNLGMNVIVLDVNAGAWKLETERGVIMDGDKSEHLLEAIPVMGSFCDLIGIRSFAGLTDREYDYAETIVNQFVKYAGKPVFAMETATVHPLQAFADLKEQKNLSYSLRKVAHPFKSSLNSMLLPILSQPEAFAALTNVNYVKNAIFENYFEQFSHFSTV